MARERADEGAVHGGVAPIPIGLVAKKAARIAHPRADGEPAKSLQRRLSDVVRHEAELRFLISLADNVRQGKLEAVHPFDGTRFDPTLPYHDPSWPMWCLHADQQQAALRLLFGHPVPDQERELAHEIAPVRAPPDYGLLASRARLLEVFGPWGLRKAWFKDLRSHEWLRQAREVVGVRYRGSAVEPMFCPLKAMQGMRRHSVAGKRLGEDAGWEILEHEFASVYAANRYGDPRRGARSEQTSTLRRAVMQVVGQPGPDSGSAELIGARSTIAGPQP